MRVNQVRVILLCALLVIIAAKSPIRGSLDDTMNLSDEFRAFIPQPQLGYVIKASDDISAMVLLESSQQGIQNDDVKYLNVANRPEIRIVLGRQSLSQNEKSIRFLSNQPDTEYIAPVHTLNGETVAIIPEIIVRLNHETDYEKLEDLCREKNCTIIRNLLYTKLEYLISPPAENAEDVLTTVEEFSSANFVEWAWPNIAFQPKLCGSSVTNEPNRVEPNDLYFDRQWHLDAIRAPEAWAYAHNTGDPNIIVAVLDEGVNIDHPDLFNNIWTNPGEIPGNGIDDDNNGFVDDVHGWDFVNNDNDVNPVGWSSAHGTACAGLIAAQGNNSVGVTGVTWNCSIMPIRIAPSPATDCDTMTEPVEGLRYSAAQGADVINNSWFIPKGWDCEPIHSVIKDITKPSGIGRNGKGCVVIFASGNWDGDGPVGYPAKYPEAIAVGAIDQNDLVWYYSGSGPELDIVAPSGNAELKGNLWTTDISGSEGYNNRDTNIFDYTDKMGGTSAACPIVAGVAALILSIDPNLSNIEVQNILLHSARDLGLSGWDEYYGFGCVDAYEAVLMTLSPPEYTLYVDDDAPNDPGPGDPDISDPNENGSFGHPFDSIQQAINNAVPGGTIIVRSGTYSGEGNYNIDFRGKPITLQSKDGPESCIIDCQEKGRGFYFHSGEGANSVIDGLKITNGISIKDYYSIPDSFGGGILCYWSSPTITNCIITSNTANIGGGLCNFTCSPIIIKCIFNRNNAEYLNDSDGGGICNFSSSPIITNCVFDGNKATHNGGGLSSDSGDGLIVTNCKFSGNSSLFSGGGIYNSYNLNVTVNNCTFIGNSSIFGGGMHNNNSSLTVTNCTFTGNISNNSNFGVMHNINSSNPTVTNSIFWDNTDIEISGDAIVNYSNIQGGWEGIGEGNIDVDPLFINTGYWEPNGTPDDPDDDFWVDGDYHLKSQAGRWDPISETWVQDDVTSPCIDAGDPTSDVSLEPEPNGGRINMGAYGGTAEASKSPEN